MFYATKSVVVHLSHCRAKWHYRGKLDGLYEQIGRREIPVNRLYGFVYEREGFTSIDKSLQSKEIGYRIRKIPPKVPPSKIDSGSIEASESGVAI